MEYQENKLEELVGSYPTCSACGSKKLVRGAWAKWNGLSREWVLKSVFDKFGCDVCGEDTSPVWKLDHEFRKRRIQRFNDDARIGLFRHGTVVITSGIQALEEKLRAAVVDQIGKFDSFTEDNDPHGEHDFGSIDIAGLKIFWKVDNFDLEMKMHSPDPANQEVTHRVLTIMLASEY